MMTFFRTLIVGFVAVASGLVLRHQEDSLRSPPSEPRVFNAFKAFDESGAFDQSELQQCSLRQDVMNEVSTSSASCNAFAVSQGAPNVDFVSFIKTTDEDRPHEAPAGQRAVWVSGYPRSGSSTVLSMVSATMDDNMDPGSTFSIFEPCHDGDEYAKWLVDKKGDATCSYVLQGITTCDFSGVENLWGWWDPHSSNNHTKFNAHTAHELCAASDLIAFKTVDYGHTLKDWTWFLDEHPNVRVVDVVRDPRGIFASWKTLEPFATLIKEGFEDGRPFYTLTEICDHFAMNIELNDTRIHRVVFEELMDHPHLVTREVYSFLGMPFGEKQLNWIDNVFNSTDCPPPPPGMEGFTDCHTNSGSTVVERWRTVLDEEEMNLWKNHNSCQEVAKYYNLKD